MGAWGATLFEDDASLDWLDGDYAASGASAVASALDKAANCPVTEYLEVDDGAAALMAGEVVATAHGDMPDEISQDMLERLNAHGSAVRDLPDGKRRARKALERVISDNSELHELWAESDDQADWVASVNDLRRRLA